MKIPFSRPWFGKRRPFGLLPETKAVQDVLESGWLTTGPVCEQLERKVCEMTGAPAAAAASSASMGMVLALRAAGIEPGDTVVVPTLTFVSTLRAVEIAGAYPEFADVGEGLWQMSDETIDEALDGVSPRAIMPVHYAGRPHRRLRTEATRVDDAAPALGARYRDGTAVGAEHPTVFSFDAIKPATCGEGGVVVGPTELIERVKLLRNVGITRSTRERYLSGSTGYDVTMGGWKANLPDILAAIALEQLKRLDAARERRRAIAEEYSSTFYECRLLEAPHAHPGHAWHVYALKVLEGARDAVVRHLANVGVQTSMHFPPLHQLSYVRERYGMIKCPNADRAAATLVSLPIYPGLSDDEVRYVIDAVVEAVSKFGRPYR